MMNAQKTPESKVSVEDGASPDNSWNSVPTLFMFGDSSGDPSRSDKSFEINPYYIVCTVVLDPLEMLRVDSMVDGLKKKHFEKRDPLSVKFHGREMEKLIKDYINDRKLRKEKYVNVYDDLVKLVCDMNVKINIVVLDKMSPNENCDHSVIEEKSWAKAALMFIQTINTSTKPMVGVSVLDKYERDAIRTVNRAFMQEANLSLLSHKNPNRGILPKAMFIESDSSNLLQLADMIAHIVMRHYRYGNDKNFERWYSIIDAKIERVGHLTA